MTINQPSAAIVDKSAVDECREYAAQIFRQAWPQYSRSDIELE